MHGHVHAPIYTSSQYGYDDANDLGVAVFHGRLCFSYARQGCPLQPLLRRPYINKLEEDRDCLFATGMAALTAIFYTLLKVYGSPGL